MANRRSGPFYFDVECQNFVRDEIVDSENESANGYSSDEYAESADEGTFLDDGYSPGWTRCALIFWEDGDEFSCMEVRSVDPRQLVDPNLILNISVSITHQRIQSIPGRVFAMGGKS